MGSPTNSLVDSSVGDYLHPEFPPQTLVRVLIQVQTTASPATYQAIQLGDGALGARLADIPNLHAALSPRVHMPGWVADSHGTHHLAMAQGIDLTGMAGDARASKGIVRKWNWLHLPVCAHVK